MPFDRIFSWSGDNVLDDRFPTQHSNNGAWSRALLLFLVRYSNFLFWQTLTLVVSQFSAVKRRDSRAFTWWCFKYVPIGISESKCRGPVFLKSCNYPCIQKGHTCSTRYTISFRCFYRWFDTESVQNRQSGLNRVQGPLPPLYQTLMGRH